MPSRMSFAVITLSVGFWDRSLCQESTVTFCPVILSGVSACNVRPPTVKGAGPEVAISELN